jgi:hypothetical protein
MDRWVDKEGRQEPLTDAHPKAQAVSHNTKAFFNHIARLLQKPWLILTAEDTAEGGRGEGLGGRRRGGGGEKGQVEDDVGHQAAVDILMCDTLRYL